MPTLVTLLLLLLFAIATKATPQPSFSSLVSHRAAQPLPELSSLRATTVKTRHAIILLAESETQPQPESETEPPQPEQEFTEPEQELPASESETEATEPESESEATEPESETETEVEPEVTHDTEPENETEPERSAEPETDSETEPEWVYDLLTRLHNSTLFSPSAQQQHQSAVVGHYYFPALSSTQVHNASACTALTRLNTQFAIPQPAHEMSVFADELRRLVQDAITDVSVEQIHVTNLQSGTRRQLLQTDQEWHEHHLELLLVDPEMVEPEPECQPECEPEPEPETDDFQPEPVPDEIPADLVLVWCAVHAAVLLTVAPFFIRQRHTVALYTRMYSITIVCNLAAFALLAILACNAKGWIEGTPAWRAVAFLIPFFQTLFVLSFHARIFRLRLLLRFNTLRIGMVERQRLRKPVYQFRLPLRRLHKMVQPRFIWAVFSCSCLVSWTVLAVAHGTLSPSAILHFNSGYAYFLSGSLFVAALAAAVLRMQDNYRMMTELYVATVWLCGDLLLAVLRDYVVAEPGGDIVYTYYMLCCVTGIMCLTMVLPVISGACSKQWGEAHERTIGKSAMFIALRRIRHSVSSAFSASHSSSSPAKPQRQEPPPATSLMDVLEDGQGRQWMLRFLIKELCVENLAFYEAVQRFEDDWLSSEAPDECEAQHVTVDVNPPPSPPNTAAVTRQAHLNGRGQTMEEHAISIGHQFVHRGSAFEINISHSQRARLEEQLVARDIHANMFCVSKVEVFRLLGSNSLLRFLKSTECKRWKAGEQTSGQTLQAPPSVQPPGSPTYSKSVSKSKYGW